MFFASQEFTEFKWHSNILSFFFFNEKFARCHSQKRCNTLYKSFLKIREYSWAACDEDEGLWTWIFKKKNVVFGEEGDKERNLVSWSHKAKRIKTQDCST